jgi:SPP1 gp7 family putative phage head morphogenesis protein
MSIKPEDKKEFKENKYRRGLTTFEEKNNIDLIQNDFDTLQVKFADEISNVVEDIKDAMMINIKRKGIIANKDFEAINKLAIAGEDKKNLTKIFIRNINKAWRQAKDTASTQIESSIKNIKLAENTGALTPKEALNYLNNKAINVSGIETEFIQKKVKDILTNGLRNGKSEQEIVFELNNFFKEYDFQQTLPDGTKANIEDIKGRLNTIVRTNFNDAYNQGRLAMYNDKNVNDYIAAYQYSAILDDVTTDFCREYDGKVYEKDDPIWSSITPPNHYNCRSTIIPVFIDDKYTVDKPLSIQQPEGFGGESVRK